MVTVHTSGGSAVLRAAVQAAAPFPQLRVLALTVITSLADQDLPEIGLAPSVQQQVLRLAALAARAQCHGVVASALEAAYLRAALPAGTLIVAAGLQLPGSAAGDQARVATPQMAAAAGANHVIMGRDIARAAQPQLAFAQTLALFQAGRRST